MLSRCQLLMLMSSLQNNMNGLCIASYPTYQRQAFHLAGLACYFESSQTVFSSLNRTKKGAPPFRSLLSLYVLPFHFHAKQIKTTAEK